MQLPVSSASTARAMVICAQFQQGVVTQDQQLLSIIAPRYYIRGVHLKSKFKQTEKAGVVISWLLHRYQYARHYYSE